MIRKTILVLAAVAILMGVTGAALVAQAFKPSGPGSVYNELINRPTYLQDKLLGGCHDYAIDCVLVVW